MTFLSPGWPYTSARAPSSLSVSEWASLPKSLPLRVSAKLSVFFLRNLWYFKKASLSRREENRSEFARSLFEYAGVSSARAVRRAAVAAAAATGMFHSCARMESFKKWCYRNYTRIHGGHEQTWGADTNF